MSLTNAERQKKHRDKIKEELVLLRKLHADHQPTIIKQPDQCIECQSSLFYVAGNQLECHQCHTLYDI